jgi:hypothetical protein
MERGLIDNFRWKVLHWFDDPLGEISALEPKETHLKETCECFDLSRTEPRSNGGRGAKQVAPHRIDEFHPRGAAGRREIHGLKGPRKVSLPHRGNRPKYPK